MLNNIRSFEGDNLFEFSPKINLLVGPNNCGKSTVVWALGLFQTGKGNWSSPNDEATLRLNTRIGFVQARFDQFDDTLQGSLARRRESGLHNRGVRIEFSQPNRRKFYPVNQEGTTQAAWDGIPQVFSHSPPNNLYHLFLSRRKAEGYQPAVNLEAQNTVRSTIAFLAAKVDRLTAGAHGPRRRYEEYLDRVLGFQMATKAISDGKSAGMYVGPNEDFVRIDYMGEGTSNIAAILADLVVAKDKVFLIEELENDIHPGALKPLLEIIGECAEHNQFIISTHSHIVLSRLGAMDEARVFNLSLDRSKEVPTSVIKTLGASPGDRLAVMNDLGYDQVDSGHWDGVLVLEESSAETVIREILIPHFAPKLGGRLRTISASGLSRVELTYDALHYTYLYLHLSPIYQNKSWIRIDEGKASGEIIAKLKTKYGVGSDTKFMMYQKPDFELYYPEPFQAEVVTALANRDKGSKREAKKALLLKVVDWALANPSLAKAEFEKSAIEVITDLQSIERQLLV